MVNTVVNLLRYLFDNQPKYDTVSKNDESIDLKRVWPFFTLHIACFAALLLPISWFAIMVCIISYSIRMFAITGFFHRYFSHKTFKPASRNALVLS